MADQDAATKLLLALSGPLLGLLGVLAGGLIALATTWAAEQRRRRHERREKLDSLRREALSIALEWIEPMRLAHNNASLMLMAATRGDLDHDRLVADWPYLLGDLKKYDLSSSQRAVLPDDSCGAGTRIVRELDDLRILGVRYAQAFASGRPLGVDCGPRLDAIDAKITRLEADLRREFRATFE